MRSSRSRTGAIPGATCAISGSFRRGTSSSRRSYRKLPRTLRDINITGGEPFLRDDLVEIVRILDEHCDHPRIVISTNGFERRRIAHAAPGLLKIGRNVGIAVSLDGIGEKHDEIRGIPGGFDKVVETLKQLPDDRLPKRPRRVHRPAKQREASRRRVRSLPAVRVSVHDVRRAELGVLFLDGGEPDGRSARSLRRAHVRDAQGALEPQPQAMAAGVFLRGGSRVQRFEGAHSRLPRGAGFLLHGSGRFRLSVPHAQQAMGDIRTRAFDEIWGGAAADGVRGEVDLCRQPCWMICTARTAMMRRPHEPAMWILCELAQDRRRGKRWADAAWRRMHRGGSAAGNVSGSR